MLGQRAAVVAALECEWASLQCGIYPPVGVLRIMEIMLNAGVYLMH